MKTKKRILLWPEMDAELRYKAIARLNALALAKVRYDGTLLPFGWAEAVAPALRYHITRAFTGAPTEIWTAEVTKALRAAGIHSIFDVPMGGREAA